MVGALYNLQRPVKLVFYIGSYHANNDLKQKPSCTAFENAYKNVIWKATSKWFPCIRIVDADSSQYYICATSKDHTALACLFFSIILQPKRW